MAKKVEKETKQVSKTPQVNVVLSFGGLEYKTEAPTILEAINKLNPVVIKSVGTLTAYVGNKTSSLTFYPRVVRKLIVNGILRQITAKRLELKLK